MYVIKNSFLFSEKYIFLLTFVIDKFISSNTKKLLITTKQLVLIVNSI